MKRHIPVLCVAALGLVFASAHLMAAPTSSATSNVFQVPESIDATGATDVSAQMAAFFASVPDNSVVDLAPYGRYHMDQTLVLSGRHNLVIRGHHATFFAVSQGTFNRSNVRIKDSSSIIVFDLAVKGANPYAGTSNPAYVAALEHQHGFELLSVTNVALVDVTATDTYGDFVYMFRVPNHPFSNGVMVINSHFARSGRQGITLVGARNVDIERNTISAVRASSIDFEPDHLDGVENVIVRSNTFSSVRGLFVAGNGGGFVNHITISGNALHGVTMQVWAETFTPGFRLDWKVFGNTSDKSLGNPHGAAMRITGMNGADVYGNYQQFDIDRNMVVANVTNSCAVTVHDNLRPGSIGESRVVGSC